MALVISLDVLAVCILIFLALSRKLEGALPAAAFLLLLFPAGSRIAIPGVFDLTTQRILVAVLLALYLAPGIGPSRTDRRRRLPLKYLMAITIVWLLISSANSAVPTISFKAVLSQVLDFFLVFYILCKTITRTATIRKILYAMVCAMGFLSALGAVEAYTGWHVVSLFPAVAGRFNEAAGAVSARGLRVAATFPHPILFGTALAVTIPIALYLLSIARSSGRRLVLWTIILLMFLNIYKTGSRGPWLALILSMGLLSLFGYHRVRKYVFVIVFLSMTVLIVRPGVWDTISRYYSATVNPNTAMGASYEWRYALYDKAVSELDKSVPRALWGYGLGSFYYLGWRGEFYGRMVPFQSCDSSVAELMIETGYPGFAITFALLLIPTLVAFRHYHSMSRVDGQLCLVFLCSLSAYLFMMTNVACYGWGQQNYFLWISAAFAMVYPRLAAAETVEEHSDLRLSAEFQKVSLSHEEQNRLGRFGPFEREA